MLLFKRPDEPADFADVVKDAKQHVADAVASKRPLKTKEDFPNLWTEFKHHFSKAQRGKCGFCERDATTHGGDVEHYRPKNGLQDLPDDPSERGKEDEYGGFLREKRKLKWLFDMAYWWLAYEWSNYLLSCARCNRGWKRCLFPIAEVPRPRAPSSGDVETPLLLSPFGPDDPTQHLAFNEFGAIEARGGSDMGRATIDTCGLDQPSLVRSRSFVARRAYDLLRDLEQAATLEERKLALRRLRELGGDEQPHAGMVRSIVEVEVDIRWSELFP
jgi:hypothetical protein